MRAVCAISQVLQLPRWYGAFGALMQMSKVLVVDDNAENRALAEATLSDEGYSVELATSGADAIATCARRLPDCVVLDIRMPGMDGIQACREIRALPGGADVPILFLTAQRDVDTFDRATAAGGDDYITKPVRPTELVTRVAAAVKLRRMAIERGELYELSRRQRDDLMRLQLHKEQLTAFLVHDLKNPVNAIGLHAERILRDRDGTPRARDAAVRIRDEGAALMRMITTLLDVSKADEGRLVPSIESVGMRELFDQVLEEMTVRAQTAGVALVARPIETPLTADRGLLRRVLENLVDNALRHSPEGTMVRLAGRVADGGIEIRVVDAGPGVPVDQRDRVFDRFVSGTEGASNRGLGLAFCKLAIEAHGGRIWIEDASPGAAFCVWVPRRD